MNIFAYRAINNNNKLLDDQSEAPDSLVYSTLLLLTYCCRVQGKMVVLQLAFPRVFVDYLLDLQQGTCVNVPAKDGDGNLGCNSNPELYQVLCTGVVM